MYINFEESFQEMKKKSTTQNISRFLIIYTDHYESWELDGTYLQTKQVRDDEWEQLEAEGHCLC